MGARLACNSPLDQIILWRDIQDLEIRYTIRVCGDYTGKVLLVATGMHMLFELTQMFSSHLSVAIRNTGVSRFVVWLSSDGSNRTDTTQRNKFISSPYNFPYSGGYNYVDGVYVQGSAGVWWSRSSFTTAGQAYNFDLTTDGYVAPQNVSNVGYGFAIRCVGE